MNPQSGDVPQTQIGGSPDMVAWVAPIAAAGISAAASLYAGAKNSSSNRKVAYEQIKQQERFAQQALQWRVADAKAAGLHPVYALGAQLPSYSPVSMPTDSYSGIADAGEHIARGIMSWADRHEREEQKHYAAENMRWMHQKLRSEVGLLNAQMNREQEEFLMLQTQHARLRELINLNQDRHATGDKAAGFEYVPAEIVRSAEGDRSTQIGPRQAFWAPFWLSDKVPIDLPSQVAAESLDGLESVPLQAMVVIGNLERHGPDWIKTARKYLPTWSWDKIQEYIDALK